MVHGRAADRARGTARSWMDAAQVLQNPASVMCA
jgi:hypothetical protein